jgi:hypothetical protein
MQHWLPCAFASGVGLYLFLVLCAGVGLFLFIAGFSAFREYRLVENMPEMPLRSIAMGLVRVRGEAQGDQLLTSPLTRTPCFYYKVILGERTRDEGGNTEWSECTTDVAEVNFNLVDSTGKVLVEPHGAEYDLPEHFKAETGSGGKMKRQGDPSLGSEPGPPESQLMEYASRRRSQVREKVSSVPGGGVMGKVMDYDQKLEAHNVVVSVGGVSLGATRTTLGYRFTEFCLLPGREYTVTGTCAENPNPRDNYDRNLLVKGRHDPTLLISSKTGKQLERGLRRKALFLVLFGAAMMVGCVAIILAKLGLF